MSRAELNEEAVFDITRHIEDPDVRKDYVEQACANAPALKARVDELLKLHDEEASFLESPPQGLPPTAEVSQVTEKVTQVTEKVDRTISRYTLREQIGEGGMGVVYVAQQEKPLRRKVALKVIKPGMEENGDRQWRMGMENGDRQILSMI